MSMDVRDRRVAIVETDREYPAESPYHPSVRYPECPFEGVAPGSRPNRVYGAVRRLFQHLGLDRERQGTPGWNPLGSLVRPGDQVLIKPNLVLHENRLGGDPSSVFTHASVLRPIVDYVVIALQGEGRIVVGDAPLQSCDFDRVAGRSGIDSLVEFYRSRGVEIGLYDFRLVTSKNTLFPGRRHATRGDDAGFSAVDLGRSSRHQEANAWQRFRVTNYDPSFMGRYHSGARHAYIIANRILDSDVIINVPKLKTHRKVGMTCCLKNLIGINGHKDCLPHHKRGSVEEGGDEYRYRSLTKDLHLRIVEAQDRAESNLVRLAWQVPKGLSYRLARRVSPDRYFEGSWYGNDTLWRTLVDLNKILLFWDRSRGELSRRVQRRAFCVVDAIVAGEGEGPLEPTPRPLGMVMAGRNPVAADAVCARVIGFDYRRIPAIVESGAAIMRFGFDQIEVVSDSPRWAGLAVDRPGDSAGFRPPAGWRDHIELGASAAVASA